MSVDPHHFRYIGKPLPRKEDHRLLTGRGRFSDDFHLPAQLYAAIVRSPHAHARINGIDTTVASSSAGVHLVVTGKDITADGLGAIDHSPLPKTKYDLKLRGPNDTDVFVGPHVVLPEDKVRHVGEAVAMVVAETQAKAIEAAEKINVEYDTLPAVIGINRALDAHNTPVWDQKPDNVFVDCTFGDAAATEQAFSSATHIISDEFQIQRVTGVPLEPRTALGEYDTATARYTLHAGSGGAVRQKNEIAKVLGADADALRVLSFDVGGNFGTRNRTYVEFVLVLYAAEKLRRPVKYTASRSEAFLSDYQGRDFRSTVSLALDGDGKFLALKADNISNGGARCVSLSPLGKGSALITGSYDIPVASLRARAVFTNTVPTQAYRSSGRPEVTYVIEQLVDKAARELGFDPMALRRQNMTPGSAMPYRNAVGVRYDSGDYFGNMRKLLELSDSAGFAERQRDAQTRGRLLGFGFANYVESSVGAPKERADLVVNPCGDITLVVGTQPSGQGHETSFSQVTADLLQIDIDVITVVLSDTDVVSLGGGSHSGRSMRHAGLVIGRATNDLIELARARTAELFEVNVETIEYSGGRCGVPGTDLYRSLAEIAASTPQAELRVRHTTEMHDPVFPCGAAACEVEIDPDTGETQITRYASVDDVGRCINPLIVHGQTHGAIVQGVGQAYGEEIVVDSDTGQTWSGSFMDYRMPRATDLPMFDTAIVETISPTNPLGIKSGGEGGTTPALSAFVSAVANAIAPWHPEPLEMPVTPQAIWRALELYRAQGLSPRNSQNPLTNSRATMKHQLNVIAFPGAPNLPIFVAQEKKFFDELDLSIELTTTPSSVFQFEKLSEGAFEIAMTAFDNVVAYREGQGAANLTGASDFYALMGATQIELSFVVSPDVKSYADLKGRTIALDALATGFAFVLYEMLTKNGLELSDIEMVAVGATPDRWNSVKDGTHAGTLTIEPFTSLAAAAGFPVLDVSSNVVDSYQGGVIAASRAWADANADTVDAYLRGYLKGLAWTLDTANRDEAKEILLEAMSAIKPGVADAVMKSLLSPASGLTPGGATLPDGMQTVLALRSKYGSGGTLENVDQYSDLKFMQRAQRPA